MTTQNPRPKIGLIVSTLMKDEFNDFTSTRQAALEKAALLGEICGEMGDVVSSGLMENLDDADRIAKLFASENVDAIVYTALSYNKGIVTVRPFLGSDIPLLIWNTQHLPAVTGDADFDLMWTNSGLAGIPELTHTLLRAGRSFEFVTGHMEDARVHERIRKFLGIALIAKHLRNARIAMVGQTYPGMTDFMTDNFDLHTNLGPMCLPVDPGLIAEEMDNVSLSNVKSLVRDTCERHKIGVSDQQTIEHSARLALAMTKVVCGDFGADAAGVQDQVWLRDPRVGIPPTFGYMHLYNNGVPCANEVDVATCVALMIFQSLSGRSAIAEFFDMNFADESVILAHDTNGNPAMALRDEDVVIKEAPVYTGIHGSGVTCEFLYPRGDVTLLSIAPLPDGWKMIASEGKSVEVETRPIGAPFLKFRPEGKSLAEFCDGWCRSGATHHMAFCYGKWAGQIESLSNLLGVGFAKV